MKRKPRVIEIKGMRGLFLAIFSVICLAAGFVAFPGYLAELVWNYVAAQSSLPVINLFQGVLLWAIVVISCYIVSVKNKKSFIEFKSTSELNDAEVRQIMSMVKNQSNGKIQPMIVSAEDFEKFCQQQMIKPVDFQKNTEVNVPQEEKEKEQV